MVGTLKVQWIFFTFLFEHPVCSCHIKIWTLTGYEANQEQRYYPNLLDKNTLYRNSITRMCVS